MKHPLCVTLREPSFQRLTFLVLSIAFSMDKFRSSKAARTFSYSPRCWEKYSSQQKDRKTKRSILWVKQLRQGCGCSIEAALVWHLSHTASRGLSMWPHLMWLFSYAAKMSNSIWVYAAPHWEAEQDKVITDIKSCFLFRWRVNLPQSSSVSTLLQSKKRDTFK